MVSTSGTVSTHTHTHAHTHTHFKYKLSTHTFQHNCTPQKKITKPQNVLLVQNQNSNQIYIPLLAAPHRSLLVKKDLRLVHECFALPAEGRAIRIPSALVLGTGRADVVSFFFEGFGIVLKTILFF